MCRVEKCCYVLPLDFGCLMLGYSSFIFSLIMAIYSAVVLALEHVHPQQGNDQLKLLTHLDLDTSPAKIILSIIILVQILWMGFSIMLIIGIKKNRSSLVLGYFSYGIVVTILMMLSALLVLLKGHWILSLVEFTVAMLYIHFLIMVHSAYELMQRGKVFGGNQHQLLDEDHLIDPPL